MVARKGYMVSQDGSLVTRPVQQKLSGRASRKYRAISVFHPETGVVVPVLVHQLVAYSKFGEAMFEPGVVVRHLNDDPLDNSWDNIVLGTPRDNALDRPKADRVLHAQKAGRTNSRSDSFWEQVAAEHAAGASYKELCEKHGLSKSTLSFRLSKTGKRTVLK
jgi:hypothetical protein